MNYFDHYDRLIARARTRVLEGYRERHHVLPRCMGGSNEAARDDPHQRLARNRRGHGAPRKLAESAVQIAR